MIDPRIDRLVDGRRFRVSTEAKTRLEHRQRLALVEKLLRASQTETLRALADGRLRWSDLIQADREGRLLHVAERIALKAPFLAVAERLFAPARRTEGRYLQSLGWLATELGTTATIEDLAHVPWLEWARAWPHSGTHWNHLRRAICRLCSLTTTKGHPFWLDLRSRIPTMRERVRVPTHTPAQLAAVLERGPIDVADFCRLILLVGLRPEETGRLRPALLHGYALTIPATKVVRVYPDVALDPRTVGLVGRVLADPPGYKKVRRALAGACGFVGVPALYHRALRHLAAQWMDEAGLPGGVIAGALGHELRETTDRYRLAPFTADHATRYTDWLVGRGIVRPGSSILPLRKRGLR